MPDATHTDNHTPSETSLLATLKDRNDTVFAGSKHSDSAHKSLKHDGIQDATGAYYSNPHDHVEFKTVSGERVGVFVGDFDGRNAFPHEYDHLPHGIGLYVKEGYRRTGIASELLNSFMEAADADTYVSDCTRHAALFHLQTDWDVIHLGQVKHGGDPSHPPLVEINTTPSPAHDIPVFEADSPSIDAYKQQCGTNNVPAVYITISPRICETRVPDTHALGGDETTNVYVESHRNANRTDVCRVSISYDTVDADCPGIDDLETIAEDSDVDASGRLGVWRYTTPIETTCSFQPEKAKTIADKTYDIVTTNTTPN